LLSDPQKLAEAIASPLKRGDHIQVRGLLAQALSLWRPMDMAGAGVLAAEHAGINSLLDGGAGPKDLAAKLAELAASQSCLGCGSCCRTSSPTLYTKDLPLIISGGLPKEKLYTIRAGEKAYSARLDKLDTLPHDLVKLAEAQGACLFLHGSRCDIYPDRPLQCRHLECWSGRHAGQLSRQPRLLRQEIFQGDETALALIAEYEVKLPAAELTFCLQKSCNGSEEAKTELLKLLELDHRLRGGIAERYGYGLDIQPLLLGRPLLQMLASYGLELGLDHNQQPVLASTASNGK
jgi:Fe-S-cluster containining protein